MKNINKAALTAKVNKLGQVERITKALLANISRELLAYVYQSNDIAMANRLLDVLTPVNKQVAQQFLTALLGWTFNSKTLKFGKKQKDKVFAKKAYDCEEFLGVETNTVWTWAEAEIVIEPKAKQYAEKIAKLVDKALKDENEGISPQELMFAILASDSITLADILAPLKEVNAVDVAA